MRPCDRMRILPTLLRRTLGMCRSLRTGTIQRFAARTRRRLPPVASVRPRPMFPILLRLPTSRREPRRSATQSAAGGQNPAAAGKTALCAESTRYGAASRPSAGAAAEREPPCRQASRADDGQGISAAFRFDATRAAGPSRRAVEALIEAV